MFVRKKNNEKSPRELFDTLGKDLLKLIDQADLESIQTFMSGVTEPVSSILHLYDPRVRSLISAINKHPDIASYFFKLLIQEYAMGPLADKEGYYLYHWSLVLNQIAWIMQNSNLHTDFNLQTQAKQYSNPQFAIELTAHHGALQALDFLIKQNKDFIRQVNSSLFMQGVRKGHLPIIKRLIEAGVSLRKLEPRENASETALAEAARLGYLDIANYFLNEYPDQTIHTQEVIEQALQNAVFEGHSDIMLLLMQRFEGDIKSLIKHISFDRHSEGRNHVECLRLLLDHGADPNTALYRKSLLSKAASEKNPEAVTLLLQRGATPTLDGFHYSLHGRSSKDIEIVETILDAITNPTATQFDDIMRHAALYECDIDMLNMLVKRGAEIPGSALGNAIYEGKINFFHALLTNYPTHFSYENIKDAAVVALERGYADLFEALYARLDPVDPNDFAPSIHIEKQERPGFMNELASQQHPDMMQIDGDEYLAMQEKKEKIKVDHPQCLQFLLRKGLGTNTPLRNNERLLERAAKANNIDACRTLLSKGANPNLAQSTLPLLSAVHNRNADLAILLLDNEATLGDALKIARKRRFMDLAVLLEQYQPEHYYIYCGVSMLSVYGAGIFNHTFSMLVKEPQLLPKLLGGIEPNCRFAQLKDIIPTLKRHDSLPDGLVDMGLDENSEREETMDFDFYYDCEGLDFETVSKAIEILKEKYLLREMRSLSSSDSDEDNETKREEMESKMLFDPVTVITKVLLSITNPELSLSEKQDGEYSGDESYPDSEMMGEDEKVFESGAESAEAQDGSSAESSPLLKRRKF